MYIRTYSLDAVTFSEFGLRKQMPIWQPQIYTAHHKSTQMFPKLMGGINFRERFYKKKPNVLSSENVTYQLIQ